MTTDLLSPSATIAWDLPPVEEQNGVITGSIVTVTNLDVGVTNTHSTSSAQFSLTNLEPNTMYTVTVRARTSEGSGPSSMISTFNTRTGGEWVESGRVCMYVAIGDCEFESSSLWYDNVSFL